MDSNGLSKYVKNFRSSLISTAEKLYKDCKLIINFKTLSRSYEKSG